MFVGESSDVRARLGEHKLSDAGADSVDSREVDAGDAPEDGSRLLVTTSLDGSLLERVVVCWHWYSVALRRRQLFEFLEQTRFVGRDLRFQGVKEAECRSQVEEMLSAPVASQILLDFLDGLAAATMTMRCESCGIAFSSHDGAQDRHSSQAGQI